MFKLHPLKEIVSNYKQGIPKGICSICCSNAYAIETAMEKALENNSYVLLEATANQVNQFGGYTGMNPSDFKVFVFSIADKVKFPHDRIILGGDHLGPLTWKDEPAEIAMQKAKELIRYYVLAGFNKIHIDTSMHLGGDLKEKPVDISVIAERAAVLCSAAEQAFEEFSGLTGTSVAPVYVIGSEVPIPGGVQGPENELQITKVQDFDNTLAVFKQTFEMQGLSKAWENVIGVVVQPGVEFGDDAIHEYDSEKAKGLSDALKKYPNIVFEGHSTDYQTANSLKLMVKDGVGILKVGPALTFALREALFLLNTIENEVLSGVKDLQGSRFIETLDEAMVKNPVYWKKYYHGDENQINFARKYSLSDRCRYYLVVPEVKRSIEIMISNLRNTGIPLALVSQFLPEQYTKIRNGTLRNDPEVILKDKIANVLENFLFATDS